MNTEQPPHSIAAIIAEIRGARNAASDITLVPTDWLTQWADRIEAAAEREARAREQAAADYAIKRGEDIHADRCRNCTERATGNVAATREALTAFVGYLTQKRIDEVWAKTTLPEPGLDRLVEQARAALAAPARNCDRFKTAVAAMEEWNKYPQSRYKGCRVCPHGDASMVSPSHLTLAEWLFAQAKGGAE